MSERKSQCNAKDVELLSDVEGPDEFKGFEGFYEFGGSLVDFTVNVHTGAAEDSDEEDANILDTADVAGFLASLAEDDSSMLQQVPQQVLQQVLQQVPQQVPQQVLQQVLQQVPES